MTNISPENCLFYIYSNLGAKNKALKSCSSALFILKIRYLYPYLTISKYVVFVGDQFI